MNTNNIQTRINDLQTEYDAMVALQSIMKDSKKLDCHLINRFNKQYPEYKAELRKENYGTVWGKIIVEKGNEELFNFSFIRHSGELPELIEKINERIRLTGDTLEKVKLQLQDLDNYTAIEAKAKADLITLYKAIRIMHTPLPNQYSIDYSITSQMLCHKAIAAIHEELKKHLPSITEKHIITADYVILGRQRQLEYDIVCLPDERDTAIAEKVNEIQQKSGVVSNICVDGKPY